MSESVIFLSRLLLNTRDRQAQQDLRDPYQMHKTLSRAWGHGDEYAAARVLFRVEEAVGEQVGVLVQSMAAPNWASLPPTYLQRPAQIKEWSPSFHTGQSLRFRLLANPTVKRGGKRCGLYAEVEQLLWLARKAELCGVAFAMTQQEHQEGFVRVPDVVVTSQGQRETEARADAPDAIFARVRCAVGQHQPVSGDASGQTQSAAFCAVRFDGTLGVTDPEKLGQALRSGIGSAKALGFGLLSLART